MEEERMQAEIDAYDRRRRRRRRMWVRGWVLKIPFHGQYDILMRELEHQDKGAFNNFVRMEPASFQELVDRVGPRISKGGHPPSPFTGTTGSFSIVCIFVFFIVIYFIQEGTYQN